MDCCRGGDFVRCRRHKAKKVVQNQPGLAARLKLLSEVCYEDSRRYCSCAVLHGDIRMEWFLIFAGGPLGILGPILLVLLGLWVGRGDRSTWYVKAALMGLLVLLFLILFGYL